MYEQEIVCMFLSSAPRTARPGEKLLQENLMEIINTSLFM